MLRRRPEGCSSEGSTSTWTSEAGTGAEISTSAWWCEMGAAGERREGRHRSQGSAQPRVRVGAQAPAALQRSTPGAAALTWRRPRPARVDGSANGASAASASSAGAAATWARRAAGRVVPVACRGGAWKVGAVGSGSETAAGRPWAPARCRGDHVSGGVQGGACLLQAAAHGHLSLGHDLGGGGKHGRQRLLGLRRWHATGRECCCGACRGQRRQRALRWERGGRLTVGAAARTCCRRRVMPRSADGAATSCPATSTGGPVSTSVPWPGARGAARHETSSMGQPADRQPAMSRRLSADRASARPPPRARTSAPGAGPRSTGTVPTTGATTPTTGTVSRFSSRPGGVGGAGGAGGTEAAGEAAGGGGGGRCARAAACLQRCLQASCASTEWPTAISQACALCMRWGVQGPRGSPPPCAAAAPWAAATPSNACQAH